MKEEAPLTQIQNATTSGEDLTINFTADSKREKWEFVCESVEVAKEWKKLIKDSYDANRLSTSNVPVELNIPEQPNRNSNLPPALANRNTHILEDLNRNSPNRNSALPQNQRSNLSVGNEPVNLEPFPGSEEALLSSEVKKVGPITENSPGEIAYRGSTIPTNMSGFSPNSRISLPQQLPANASNPYTTSPSQSHLNQSSPQLATINEQPDQEARISNPVARQSLNPLEGLGIINPSPVSPPPSQLAPEANSSPALNAKEEYMRRKKEEEEARHTLGEGNNPVNASTMSVRSGREDVEEEVATNWDYEFIKGEAEYLVVERFKKYVEGVVARIVDELGVAEARRRDKPVKQTLNEIVYEVGGVEFVMGMLELSETSNFHDRISIVSSQSNKQLRHQFKNSDYILQITNNRGRFRVPLMQLTQYKGFTVLAKSMVHTSTDFSSLSAQLQQDIGQL